MTNLFPVETLVSAGEEHPGVYLVRQPMDADGYLHLAPVDDVAREGGYCSLIIHSVWCVPLS